ncbi:CHAT domain-containing protein [Streptomyces pseudogriseolus]|uniref:CHAT domain-containing protein n=1 Tax=Streptomyces pseudogriseolus TaxID=36817 RepID=UPI0005879598|nr:CHAT domain-containing protein [Streptomyces gancidicus]
MPRSLTVRVVQDPSDGFRHLPHLHVQAPDLRVSFDVLGGGRIRARMTGPAVPALRGTEHRADLSARPDEVHGAAARLCTRWKERFVDFQPVDDQGRALRNRQRPFATAADLTAEPEHELRTVVADLARGGASLLFDTLLRGDDVQTVMFRSYLLSALSLQGLRIRFDSDLHLPWPMLCVAAAPGAGEASLDTLFARFLGHRHQIEHTGDAYAWIGAPPTTQSQPVVSLNHDVRVGRTTRADEVAKALADGTLCTVRTTYEELIRDFERPDLDEQLMYFWCHGEFVGNAPEPPVLAIRLTDGIPFDGHTVRELRAGHRHGPFHPLVLLNACYAGVAGASADRAFLSRMLIEHGAQGVLGPLIAMPQAFAAEYALEFVTRYLRAEANAGRIAHDLARHFATRYRNPLGFAYGLHGGMDARLERTDGGEA